MQNVSKNKTFVFMVTHIITRGVVNEFKKLAMTSGFDTILLIDNSNKILKNLPLNTQIELELFGNKINAFLFDKNIVNTINLPQYSQNSKRTNFSDLMWYNADYRFFMVRKYFQDYQFYWQFDYDVFFNGASYSKFFEKYNNSNIDLYISYINETKVNSDWEWTKRTEWIYDKINLYSSFFPASRLSGKAIDFLYEKRLTHKKIFEKSKTKNKRWINCELFVPTELINNGFKAERLNESLRFSPNYDLNEDRLFEKPDNILYHPIKGNYEEKIKKLSHFTINFMGIKVKLKNTN